MTDPIEPPVCVSVILCNDVIEDKRTNNKSLIGLFNLIAVPQLPIHHPRLFIVTSLTNIVGRTPFKITITAPSQREIMSLEGQVEANTPMDTHDFVAQVDGLPLEEEGIYQLQISSGSHYLSSRNFNVARIQPPASS